MCVAVGPGFLYYSPKCSTQAMKEELEECASLTPSLFGAIKCLRMEEQLGGHDSAGVGSMAFRAFDASVRFVP